MFGIRIEVRGSSPATALLSVAVKTIAMPANRLSEGPLVIVIPRRSSDITQQSITIFIYRVISVTDVTAFFHDFGEEPEDFQNEFAKGYRRRASNEFWGYPLPEFVERSAHATRCTRSEKHQIRSWREQIDIDKCKRSPSRVGYETNKHRSDNGSLF